MLWPLLSTNVRLAGQGGDLHASPKGKDHKIDRSTCACQEMCQLEYCPKWTKVCRYRQQHCCVNGTEHADDDFAICSCRAQL